MMGSPLLQLLGETFHSTNAASASALFTYPPKVLALLLLLLIGSLLLISFIYQTRTTTTRKNNNSLPAAAADTPPQCTFLSVKDIPSVLMGKDAPMKMLQLRNDMQSADFELPNLPFLPRFFVITNYRNARKILEHSASVKPTLPLDDFFQNTTHDGMNFISANGERWRHVRKSTSAAFSSQNIKLMVVAISQIVDKWVETVLHFDDDDEEEEEEEKEEEVGENKNHHGNECKNEADDNDNERHIHINVLEEMNKITANVIAKVAFDYDISDNERDAFLQDLLTCWQTFGVASALNLRKQFRGTRWMYSDIRAAKRAAKRLFHFCGKMAESYRKKIRNDSQLQQPHKLIHMILEDADYRDDGERFRDMIAFTIAGFDTTANTLSFTFLELARNTEEQTKLRDALRKCESMGGVEEANGNANSCPHLKNTVREILRLYPAVATGSFRQAVGDIVLPATQKVIPSGSLILSHYYAIQRDPQVFENPNMFLPSRWENSNVTKEQNMSFLTFSFGKRNCLGQALAYAEMYEILAKLIAKFEFGIVNEGEARSVVLFKPVGTILSVKKAL